MNMHRLLVQALSGNADPAKPDVVLSQALEAFKLDADALVSVYQESDDGELLSRLFYLRERAAAIEAFADHFLRVEYSSPAVEDAFAFDESEEQGNGTAESEASDG